MAEFFKKFSFSILGFIVLLCISVTAIVSFRPLYYYDIHHLDIVENTGIPEETIKRNFDTLIDYNQFWTGVDELNFPDFPMSESGRIHFMEVRNIFVFFQYTGLVLLLPFLILCVWLIKKNKYHFFRFLAVFTLIVPCVVCVLMAISWDRVFVLFHELVFQNDYWLFDPMTDPVIWILPDGYFLHCAIGISGLLMLGCVINYVTYYIGNRRK